jgi:two-component sensor histidine kinase
MQFHGAGSTAPLRQPHGDDALVAELAAALAREQALLRQVDELAKRQALQARELNHRLFNGLQSIASLLASQSRGATPEAAAELTVAVSRILAFGQVHRRLNLLDHHDRVEFTRYLAQLCQDLAALFTPGSGGRQITVEGVAVEIPTSSAVPLGFIVNELITNSVKYGAGDIAVRLRQSDRGTLTLSVSDQGIGLPEGFDPADSEGLGMKIVLSLVGQIPGELHILAGDGGRGACFAVSFEAPQLPHLVAPELADLPPPPQPAPPATECTAAVKRWIMQANIDQFTHQLAIETDPAKRAIIAGLLGAEQDKNALAIESEQSRP